MRCTHVGLILTALVSCGDRDQDEEVKSREGVVDPAVVRAATPLGAVVARAPSGFTTQTRLGFTAGDQWEPAIAADAAGHVYVLYPQYGGVPGCPSCPSPTMTLQVSSDGGTTWGTPRIISSPGAGQWDA